MYSLQEIRVKLVVIYMALVVGGLVSGFFIITGQNKDAVDTWGLGICIMIGILGAINLIHELRHPKSNTCQ